MITEPLPIRENLLNYMLSLLSELKGLSFRRLPGGIGFFINGRIFGAIVGGRFRLRTPDVCEHTQSDSTYLFAEWARSYCEVPDEVLQDQEQLLEWVHCAIELSKAGRESEEFQAE
jgi:TfoX/Sxy family transcriptional regulator of competence genes